MIIDATSFDTSKNVFEVYGFFLDIQRNHNIQFDTVTAITDYFAILPTVTQEDVIFEVCADMPNAVVIDFSGFCLAYSVDFF